VRDRAMSHLWGERGLTGDCVASGEGLKRKLGKITGSIEMPLVSL
ncbi:hypothetical protein LCGC14_2288970, partial [marine sediment metagenome]